MRLVDVIGEEAKLPPAFARVVDGNDLARRAFSAAYEVAPPIGGARGSLVSTRLSARETTLNASVRVSQGALSSVLVVVSRSPRGDSGAVARRGRARYRRAA